MSKKLIIAFTIVILLVPAGFVTYTIFGDMPGVSKQLTREERLEKRRQENKKLLEIARSGKDENIHYIRLAPENNYMDYVSAKSFLTRELRYGTATGSFIGNNFGFASMSCEEAFTKGAQWRPNEFHGPKKPMLETDFCIWSDENRDDAYTLRFVSWLTETGECIGDCDEHGNQTAYIRVKYNKPIKR